MEKLFITLLMLNLFACGKEEIKHKDKKRTEYNKIDSQVIPINLDQDLSQSISLKKRSLNDIYFSLNGEVTIFNQIEKVVPFEIGQVAWAAKCQLEVLSINHSPPQKIRLEDAFKYFDIYFNNYFVTSNRLGTVWEIALADPEDSIEITFQLKEKYQFKLKSGVNFDETRACGLKNINLRGKKYSHNTQEILKPLQIKGAILLEIKN